MKWFDKSTDTPAAMWPPSMSQIDKDGNTQDALNRLLVQEFDPDLQALLAPFFWVHNVWEDAFRIQQLRSLGRIAKLLEKQNRGA